MPRDVASRNAKYVCDEGRGIAGDQQVYLDFRDAINRDGEDAVKAKYGNLFHMYHKITDENPYEMPMRIFPAPHYTMGGLWVDYNLMSTIPGLHVLGEANFSDHGSNRLGASALMQGLADGYFVIPYTLGHYLATAKQPKVSTDHPAFSATEEQVNTRLAKLLANDGGETVDSFHRRLGRIMWNACGMSRTEAGLTQAIEDIQGLREEFWGNVSVTGSQGTFNQVLERAGRVADFLEFGELMCRDALTRNESCGGHFREEYQTDEGEAKRDDENYSHVAAWEFTGEDSVPVRHTEALDFEYVKLTQRSYK